MAPQTLTHRGSMMGYQAAGDEVRADAGSPRTSGALSRGQFRQPFSPPESPLGKQSPATSQKQQELPELLEDEPSADDNGWRYTATVIAPAPAYGGASWNGGGGELANAISGTAPKAIEPAKVIPGAVEDI